MRAASNEAMSSEFKFAAGVRGDLLIVTEPVSEFHAIYVKRPGKPQLGRSCVVLQAPITRLLQARSKQPQTRPAKWDGSR